MRTSYRKEVGDERERISFLAVEREKAGEEGRKEGRKEGRECGLSEWVGVYDSDVIQARRRDDVHRSKTEHGGNDGESEEGKRDSRGASRWWIPSLRAAQSNQETQKKRGRGGCSPSVPKSPEQKDFDRPPSASSHVNNPPGALQEMNISHTKHLDPSVRGIDFWFRQVH